jgi:hypothetical protein
MKKVLLSLAISFGLLVVYLIVSDVILILLSPDINHLDLKLAWEVGLPVSLPKVVYYHFFPPTAEDYTQQIGVRRALISLMLMVANVFIYAVPAYLILLIVSKRRKSEGLSPTIDVPPPPPSY